MVESATSFRPLSGAEEFDRRMRSLVQSPAPHSDALAELARLVGQQDPFREAPPTVPDDKPPEAPLAAEADYAAFDPAAADPGPATSAPPITPAIPSLDAGWDEPSGWRYPAITPRRDVPADPAPDVWAEKAGDAADDADPAAPPAVAETTPSDTGGAKRTLIVLAAVMALTGGGLAASFLTRPSGGSAVATATTTPTIMAATGPSKVQPETPTAGPDAPTAPSTLLDKNNNDGTAAAKVVNAIEQPVDLTQAIKPAPGDVAADAAAQTPPSAFPEPRKVKTVLVRPDGSIIAAAAAPAPAASEQPSLLDPATSLPIVSHGMPSPTAASAPPPADSSAPTGEAVPPKPAAPAGKTTVRATPKPAASTTQNATAAAQARTTVATPKAKPPVAHAPAKPATAADATPASPDATPTATVAAPAPAEGGGSFAVQLGAAPTEAEGHDAAKRLAQKYDLGAAKPSIVKAQAGGKTVYRIRVGRLSSEDAKALCAKVQAGGGGCFVARN